MKTIQIMALAFVCLAIGCKNGNTDLLTAHEWQLKEITGSGKSLELPEEKPTLVFTDSAAVYGFAGCNRFFGKYTVEGKNKLHIRPGGMTMMYCPDIRFEDAYVKMLEKVATFGGNRERLEMSDSTGRVTLVFIPKDTTRRIGVARDSHGCNEAAGYTWSEVRKDCIRLFETGIQLISATDSTATLAAYIVFSTDSLQAEAFVPDMKTHPVLSRRTLPSGGYAWNEEDDDTLNIRLVDGVWVIEQRDQVLYRQK